MSLRSKVGIIVLCVFLIYGVVDFGIQRFIIFPSFLSLEHEEAIKDMKRIVHAIQGEINHLDSFCADWAAWDDTYEFIETGSEDFIRANLPMSTFTGNNLNLIYFVNKNGKVIWGNAYDLNTEKKIYLDGFSDGLFSKTNPLILYNKRKRPLADITISGIFISERGPMLIASRPILNSSDKGPERGSLIMARFFNDKIVQQLVDQTQVNFELISIKPVPLSEKNEDILKKLTDKSPYMIEKNDNDVLYIYTLFPDINNKSAILIKSKLPRKIAAKGTSTLYFAMESVLLSGLCVFILVLLILQFTVLNPITKLTNHAIEIGRTGNLSTLLSMRRNDEIGTLSKELDHMMIQLQKRSSELEKLNFKLKADIIKRERVEIALRESEEQYSAVMKQSFEGIYLIDSYTKVILETNRSFQDMLGYGHDEILKYNIYDFLAYDKKDIDTHFLKVKSKKYFFVDERKYRHKNGKTLYVEERTNLITFGGSEVLCIAVRDITARKKVLEEKSRLKVKLHRAQKMEAIGTLAAGVAHDLNNVLSGIVSYPEIILFDLPEDSPLRKPILTIQNSGKKAAAIVSDLLTLARRGVAVSEVINLNRIISEYINSPEFEKLQSMYPNIQVKINLEDELLNIIGSPMHLNKTVMNLFSNAFEAIIDSGNVIISTENQYVDKQIRGYDEVKEGDYIVLSISDDGMGISSGDMERIFEPFFTRKAMGRSGTGLGMAVVWGTVKDHSGYIDVKSYEGKGTTFKLFFPVTRQKITMDKPSLPIESYMGNGETMLVVDDIEEQREIASNMLKKLGYSVICVPSGEKAIEYIKYNSADLVILDMIMDPGISGRETYERIIKFRPDQKAIIVSGYSETEDVRAIQKLGAGQYVKKPYVLEKIGVAIRDELKKAKI